MRRLCSIIHNGGHCNSMDFYFRLCIDVAFIIIYSKLYSLGMSWYQSVRTHNSLRFPLARVSITFSLQTCFQHLIFSVERLRLVLRLPCPPCRLLPERAL